MEDKEIILAQINLKGCPDMPVLDFTWLPVSDLDKQYFGVWQNVFWRTREGGWAVTKEKDREILEHPIYYDECLVTGDYLWRDYSIETKIRQMLPGSLPFLWMDHDFDITGRTGVLFRYRDNRHYYFYGIERYDRLVLLRREDRNWVVLDWRYVNFQRERYYHLKIEGKGNRLRGFLEGELALEANDDVYVSGKAGIRSNCRSRYDGVRVYTTEDAHSAFIQSKNRYDAEVAELSERYPRPVLGRKIDIDDLSTCSIRFEHLKTGDEKEILLATPRTAERGFVRAVDLTGNTLWEVTGRVGPTNVGDADGDGLQEVVAVLDGKIVLLDGETGEKTGETNLPFDDLEKIPHRIHICDLEGESAERNVVVKEDFQHIAVYDRELRLKWRRSCRYAGADVEFYDTDGDGHQEILMGFEMWRSDGSTVWEMEEAEYIWTHADSTAIGDFDGTGLQVYLAVGGEGLIQVDALTGRIRRRHYIGHAQGVAVGNFRTDLEGLEVWVHLWWGSFGIKTLFSGSGEKLFSFEPTNTGSMTTVNWSGDGEELILICPLRPDMDLRPYQGLYDAFGRRVVTFPDDSFTPSAVGISSMMGDARDKIFFTAGDSLYIYVQDTPFPTGERIYTPIRRGAVSHPRWKVN
jgi:hypothetical protein